MATGRFAPSPTGALHLGNLRTALVAWLAARSTNGRFFVRMEDLDPVVSRVEHEHSQLVDLRALGIDWDGEVVRQSERRDRYDEAINQLINDQRTYECFCTRREIQSAASAPNGPSVEGAYAKTCRGLSDARRQEKLREGRRPALRLRTDGDVVSVVDALHGTYKSAVDDFVLRRNDGMPAYNLAVVVDDAAQGVEQIVRADDLLASAPRQAYLAGLLGLEVPTYLHVPLVLGPSGDRLAKRDGAVTLADRLAHGETAVDVRARLATSLGLCAPGERPSLGELLQRFDPIRLPTVAWTLNADIVNP
jgi:glutamyl-tRNA synthetase